MIGSRFSLRMTSVLFIRLLYRSAPRSISNKRGRLKNYVQHRYVHCGGVAMSESYQHLSRDERAAIAIGLEQGLSRRAIARRLNRSPSTISREVRERRQTRVSSGAGPAAS